MKKNEAWKNWFKDCGKENQQRRTGMKKKAVWKMITTAKRKSWKN